MDTKWELVHSSLLAAQVKDANLGVWYTPAETRLGVGLVFTVAVTEIEGQNKLHITTLLS